MKTKQNVRKNFKKQLFFYILAGTFLLGTNLLHAANQVVVNLNDSGVGSLRQAITDVGDGESITFSTSGTITLAGTDLDIDKTLTIDGNNQISINGNNASRIFYIDGDSTQTVTLKNMTIENGKSTDNSGGGIYVYNGNIVIENTIIKDSQSTGAGSDGGGISLSLHVDNATLTDVRITNCSSIDMGGGMYANSVDEALTMTRCTIDNNSSSNDGGGMSLQTAGACVVTLNQCSIVDNKAVDQGGGIYFDNSTFNIYNSTIYGNNADTSDGEQIQINVDAKVNAYSTIIGGGRSLDIETVNALTTGGLTMDYCLYDATKTSINVVFRTDKLI